MKWKWLLCIWLIAAHVVHAQEFVRTKTLHLQKNSQHFFNAQDSFDALCFEADDFSGLQLYSTLFGRHTIAQDLHHGEKKSQLFVFPKDRGTLSIETNEFEGTINVIFIRTGRHTLFNQAGKQFKSSQCEKPYVVPPSIWREGLPDPKPGREYNNARHMIIHHSAGSNFNTDFSAVVRSIYLLHLESNGWDDIGYNYLIASNGTIYVGRDPLELIEEDVVRGAHFCSKNNGTMGTCLLGTFTDTVPTKNALDALHQLLLWKLSKIHIGPADSFPHPGIADAQLAVVAGHREGCNTECPGNRFFPHIAVLRQVLENDWQRCPKIATVPSHSNSSSSPYPNPLGSDDNLLHLPNSESGTYILIDFAGRIIEQGAFNHDHILFTQELLPGMYLLKTQNDDQWNNYRLIKQ